MKYKNEFSVPHWVSNEPPDIIEMDLVRRKEYSGEAIGRMLERDWGHSAHVVPHGNIVYKMEIFACSLENFNTFMKHVTSELPGEWGLKLIQWAADLSKTEK